MEFDVVLRGLGCIETAKGVLFTQNAKIAENQLPRGVSFLVVGLQ
jgi:hypothetical protein